MALIRHNLGHARAQMSSEVSKPRERVDDLRSELPDCQIQRALLFPPCDRAFELTELSRPWVKRIHLGFRTGQRDQTDFAANSAVLLAERRHDPFDSTIERRRNREEGIRGQKNASHLRSHIVAGQAMLRCSVTR